LWTALGNIAIAKGVTRNELIESWLAQLVIARIPKIAAAIDEECDGAITAAANWKESTKIEVKFLDGLNFEVKFPDAS